jgi:asparagine synthase (glutamine-hydrolysing)
LAADVVDHLAGVSPFHPCLDSIRSEVDAGDLFAVVSAWELRTYMADVLLRDSDVMSMRHSIELRVPFVDRPLIEWLWLQPSRFKSDLRQPKSVLMDATADILPPGLANRRKRGFTLPFPIWMRKDLRPFIEDTLSASTVNRSGLFSAGPIQGLWKSFLSGGDDREWSRIWSLVVLVAFTNRHKAGVSGARQTAA